MSRGAALRQVTLKTAAVLTAAVFVGGCSKPSAANIALRKQVQDLQGEIERLKLQHGADLASLGATTRPATTAPALPPGAAAGLFTTHGVRLGRLTDFDAGGLTVHVIPTDDDGNDLKAAGAIHVVASTSNDNGKPVGTWDFTAAQTRSFWNGTGLRYEYVVPCPLPGGSAPKPLFLTVTFTDALTGRAFAARVALGVEDWRHGG